MSVGELRASIADVPDDYEVVLDNAEAEKEALRAESSIARMDAERYAGNLRYIAKHAYDGERCVWCGINIYDAAEDDPCVDHEPITYTTETKPEAGDES